MICLFVDANVPTYAAGSPHPLKQPCLDVLDLVADYPRAFVTDAEVLQELLHRYLHLRFWPDPGLTVVENFEFTMRGRVAALEAADVLTAARSAESLPRLSSRDVIHLAIARRLEAQAIITADRGFDDLPDIERLDPGDVAIWRERVTTN
jgi:predicted nucleic acid-binding protein